jgi:hypothetical protein
MDREPALVEMVACQNPVGKGRTEQQYNAGRQTEDAEICFFQPVFGYCRADAQTESAGNEQSPILQVKIAVRKSLKREQCIATQAEHQRKSRMMTKRTTGNLLFYAKKGRQSVASQCCKQKNLHLAHDVITPVHKVQ